MVKALIRKGDMTTHGGKVIEGFSDYTIQNIPVAGVGHKTICPLCKGVFPIIQGYGGITVNGIFVALEGHVTACGAKLIPSQHEEVVDDGGGADVMGAAAQQPEQTQYARLSDNQRSMINEGVYFDFLALAYSFSQDAVLVSEPHLLNDQLYGLNDQYHLWYKDHLANAFPNKKAYLALYSHD